MKIYSLLVIAVCSIVFISCGNNSSVDNATTTPTTNTPAGTTQAVATQQNPAASGSSVTPPPSLAPGQLTQSASASGVVLNPAHGQPGHDCSIAVGQPLKSTTTNTSPIVNTQPTQAAQTTTAPASKPVAGQPRLNPAHGQPGHDCSIGVGMPLKN